MWMYPGTYPLESAVLGAGLLGLEIAQIAHPMIAQTAIQPRALGIRVQKLPNQGQQVIQ